MGPFLMILLGRNCMLLLLSHTKSSHSTRVSSCLAIVAFEKFVETFDPAVALWGVDGCEFLFGFQFLEYICLKFVFKFSAIICEYFL